MSAFNLIHDAWLPIERQSGARSMARPADLSDAMATDPIVALDFPRSDWNAAVTEFLIGLFGLAFAGQRQTDWATRFWEPPPPAELAATLAPLRHAFDLDGSGARAFQDMDALTNVEIRPIASLLIDAPGDNGVRLNTDLFVKRGRPRSLSRSFAAAALITLQTYAPSGGAGHRTSLRGGGPLTLLVVPQVPGAAPGSVRRGSLWRTIWANVVPLVGERTAPEDSLPWLRPTLTSEHNQVVAPSEAWPYLAYFACPRRIRLVFGGESGTCDLGGEPGPVATGFRMQNYGPNYKGWAHPLSPYRRDAARQLVAAHPTSESFDSRSFRAWWGLEGAAARNVALWQARREASELPAARIEVFGYDMDNMRARQWLERSIAWLPLHGDDAAERRLAVQQALLALDAAARGLLHALKLALFGQPHGSSYIPHAALPRQTLQEAEEVFRRETEAGLMSALAPLAWAEPGPDRTVFDAWAARRPDLVLAAFEAWLEPVATGPYNSRRVGAARRMLENAMARDGAFGRALRSADTELGALP